MDTQETKTETALTFANATLSPVFKKSEATKFMELIDKEVMLEYCDVTTVPGRKRERSLASSISAFKADMGRLSDASIKEAKEIVDGTRKYMKTFNADCDERRDKRKAASVEQEAKEQARKDGHSIDIQGFRDSTDFEGCTVDELNTRILSIQRFDLDSLEEYKEEGARVAAKSITAIASQIQKLKEQAADAAELARLQQKEAARNRINEISACSDLMFGWSIHQLKAGLSDAVATNLCYDFGDLQTEADETRANTIKEIEAAITAEENRLKLVADNQKLKEKADAAEQKILDDAKDKQYAIDAAKLAEEQEEDAVWNNAHVEYDYRQSVKNEQAETKRIEEEKADAAKETARLASEDKKHRAEVKNRIIQELTDEGIPIDFATDVVELIASGDIDNIRIQF